MFHVFSYSSAVAKYFTQKIFQHFYPFLVVYISYRQLPHELAAPVLKLDTRQGSLRFPERGRGMACTDTREGISVSRTGVKQTVLTYVYIY